MLKPRILFVCQQGRESSILAGEMRAWLLKTSRAGVFRVEHLPKGMDDNKDLLDVQHHLVGSDLIVALDRGPSMLNEIRRFIRGERHPPVVHELGPTNSLPSIDVWGEMLLEKARLSASKRH
ncbi:MAG: hypothetical protein QXR53_04835 [Candidatus Norongarragalinales archaeon]